MNKLKKMKYSLLVLTLILASSCKIKAQETESNIDCNEVTKEVSEYLDVVIIKTCEFKNHMFKSIGTPDYKGRYSYDYELFQLNKNDTIKIINSDFFNLNSKELEKLINEKLKTEYESNSKLPEISDCMKSIDFREYKLDEFGISFAENNKMEFNIDYGIGGACFNVGSSSVVIDFSELKEYLK